MWLTPEVNFAFTIICQIMATIAAYQWGKSKAHAQMFMILKTSLEESLDHASSESMKLGVLAWHRAILSHCINQGLTK